MRAGKHREPATIVEWWCDVCCKHVRLGKPGEDEPAMARHIKTAAHLACERDLRKVRELKAGIVSPYLPPPAQ